MYEIKKNTFLYDQNAVFLCVVRETHDDEMSFLLNFTVLDNVHCVLSYCLSLFNTWNQ